jgi:hypothetical protein
MTITLGSFFSWIGISSWAEVSPNQYKLAAESAGTYRIEAQLLSPTSHFSTMLNWGQYLNRSNNHRSELHQIHGYKLNSTARIGQPTYKSPHTQTRS